MYLVGKPHPAQERLVAWLRGNGDAVLVTSAEVFQEIVHRFVAIDRRSAIEDAFAVLDSLVEATHAITRDDVGLAHEIAMHHHGLSGRDCLHAAVMRSHAITRVLSMDRGFDALPGIERVP
jgi:predicted nucleic acid-binding protein